jgi:hypothetical protein
MNTRIQVIILNKISKIFRNAGINPTEYTIAYSRRPYSGVIYVYSFRATVCSFVTK